MICAGWRDRPSSAQPRHRALPMPAPRPCHCRSPLDCRSCGVPCCPGRGRLVAGWGWWPCACPVWLAGRSRALERPCKPLHRSGGVV